MCARIRRHENSYLPSRDDRSWGRRNRRGLDSPTHACADIRLSGDFDRDFHSEMVASVPEPRALQRDRLARVMCDRDADEVPVSHDVGLPPVEIDGEHYWDGGLFSNTPLEHVLDYSPRRSRLTFQVDVFQAQGRLPTNLDEVSEREKDIRYSSRTQICSKAFRDKHDVRHAINELHKLLPPDLASTAQAKRL